MTVERFVSALLRHGLFLAANLLRAAVLALTRGAFARAPVAGPLSRYWRRLAWASASFAALSDLAMIVNGSRLKFRGKLTGRFADWLSQLYLAACVLRRFEAEGRRAEDLPLARYALESCFAEMQRAREGLLRHFEGPILGWFLRGPVATLARLNPFGLGPKDDDGAACARVLLSPSAQRDRLTADLYTPSDPEEALGRIERALRLVGEATPVLDKIRQASRKGTLERAAPETLVEAAVRAGVIEARDASLVKDAATARHDATRVDSFSPEEYFREAMVPVAEEAVLTP